MGIKGLIRDSIMFATGIALLLNFLDSQTAAIILIAASVLFTVFAWMRAFKGW